MSTSREDRARLRAARVEIDGRLVAVNARVHGTRSVVDDHGCQCGPCREVAVERCRSQRERRRAAAGVQALPERVCALDSCDIRFQPRYQGNIYHQHACAAAARRVRVTRVCACGCGGTFTVSAARAARGRKYIDGEHRRRGGYATTTGKPPAKPSPLAVRGKAGAVPGAARAGKRTAPRPVPSKDRRPVQPERSVFGDAGPPAPWRPPVPVVERVARVAARPSFGLSRRSA